MKQIRQLRLGLALGVDSEGAITYSETYDLMDARDLVLLKNGFSPSMVKGFSVETSTFKEGEHTKDDIENEFHPLVTCLCAQVKDKHFIFDNETFATMPYHVIRESILDVQNDLQLLVNNIMPGDMEDALATAKEIFPQAKNPYIKERNH